MNGYHRKKGTGYGPVGVFFLSSSASSAGGSSGQRCAGGHLGHNGPWRLHHLPPAGLSRSDGRRQLCHRRCRDGHAHPRRLPRLRGPGGRGRGRAPGRLRDGPPAYGVRNPRHPRRYSDADLPLVGEPHDFGRRKQGRERRQVLSDRVPPKSGKRRWPGPRASISTR